MIIIYPPSASDRMELHSVAETTAVQRQRTVLVVEDHELSRKLLEVRLEIEGFATVATNRAEAALDIAREQRPDLILMDIQLPGISGLEAIKRRADQAHPDHRGDRVRDVL